MSGQYDISSVSSGVQYITRGYIEYAEEVICGRALVDLRDGLKVVNRRTLFTLHGRKSNNLIKGVRISGDTTQYHPHGEDSVYDALVLMTEQNGSLAFPLLTGSGNFGKYYSNEPAAAKRYTEICLHKNADEFFGEMHGIDMIPNYDATCTEPEVLPVSFPNVLVNSTSGIAVGFRANVPSFNFNDVCDLVIECINDGKCSTVIAPDFVSGGYYIKNDKELLKLMTTGSAKLKMRGKAVVVGNEIHIMDVPFGKTIQSLLKQINAKEFSSIRNAYDADDYDSGIKVTVNCKSKNTTEDALYCLYKDTDFQYTYSADLTVVDSGKPVQLGVWQIIEKWVPWRRSVIIKEQKYRIEGLRESLRESRAFLEVINHPELKSQLVSIVEQEGRDAGVKFILANFDKEIIDADLATWVCRRRLDEFHKGGKYLAQYNTYKDAIKECEDIIANVDDKIKSEMLALKAKYGATMARRTEVTTVDYEFVEGEEEKAVKIKDDSDCFYDFKDGFLRKTKYPAPVDGATCAFAGTASDTLIAFDNRGRLLRVYCQDLPFSGNSDRGIYLPRYFNLKETDDYRIFWIGRVDGSKLMLLYKDGNVGFVDTSEWSGYTRNVKILEKGIATSVAADLGAVINLTSIGDISQLVLFVTDVEGRISCAELGNIKQKDRTAKTRVFTLNKGAKIDSYGICEYNKAVFLLNNMSSYYGRLRELGNGDFRGEASDFMLMF